MIGRSRRLSTFSSNSGNKGGTVPRNFECEQPNYRLERMPKALAALRGTVTRLLSKAVAALAKTGGAVSLRAPVLQNLTAFCQLRIPPGATKGRAIHLLARINAAQARLL